MLSWNAIIASAPPIRTIRNRGGVKIENGTTTSATNMPSVIAWCTPERKVVRVPGRPRRKRLRLEMEVERGERAPSRVAAQQLGDAREQHELEEQQPEQPSDNPRRLPLAESKRREPPARSPEAGDESRLEQQGIPLEREKVLARHREGEIREPEQREHYDRADVQHQQRRSPTPASARIRSAVSLLLSQNTVGSARHTRSRRSCGPD